MKKINRVFSTFLAAVMLFVLLAGGCSNGKTVKLKPSDLTGSQVQEEFWNTNLDASAEYLKGYRAQSLDEVVKNWRQAMMQGNGAIRYALYSDELKLVFLNRMKAEFTIWNFYYGNDAAKPLEVTCSEPQPIEGVDNMYYSTVTTIESDGVTTTSYDIYMEIQDGGYFITSETSPEVVTQ